MDLSTKAREREREILLVHVLPFLFFFCETHLIFMLKDLIKNFFVSFILWEHVTKDQVYLPVEHLVD